MAVTGPSWTAIVWVRAESFVNTGRRWSPSSTSSTSDPGPPDSVNPVTSCEPRQWWARSRLESVIRTWSASWSAAARSWPLSDAA